MRKNTEKEIYELITTFYKNSGLSDKKTYEERGEASSAAINAKERLGVKAYGESVMTTLARKDATKKDLLAAQISDSIILYYRSLGVDDSKIHKAVNQVHYAVEDALNNTSYHEYAAWRVIEALNIQTSGLVQEGVISAANLGYDDGLLCKIVPEKGACEKCQGYGQNVYTYKDALAVLEEAHPNCRCQIVSLEQADMMNTKHSAVLDVRGNLKEMFEDIVNNISDAGTYGLQKLAEFASLVMQIAETPISDYALDSYMKFIQLNYAKNQETQKGIAGIIHNQTEKPISKIKMGYRDTFYNGCGWIATYNVMYLLNEPRKPADIVKYYESMGGTVLSGIAGINSIAINQYFKSNEMDTRYTMIPTEIDKNIKEAGTAVLEYAHSKGFHYVAVNYENGKYTIYNSNAGGTIVETDSISKWLKESGYFQLALITVEK